MSPVPDDDRDKHSDGEIGNMEMPNMVIPVGLENSDDEDIDDGNQGYQPLPQGPDDINENVSAESSDSEEDDVPDIATGLAPTGLYPNFPQGELPSYLQVPDLPKPDKKNLLWNQPRGSEEDVLDSGKVASIKNAMKGFELPACNVPDWAKHVPEDKWKEELISRLTSHPELTSPEQHQSASLPDDSRSGEACVEGQRSRTVNRDTSSEPG